MDKIIIKGGNPLSGNIKIGGAKNSALKLIAASLLTEKKLCLQNVPALSDVGFMCKTLEKLGVKIERNSKNSLQLQAETIRSVCAPYDLVRKMRATF